MKTMRERFEAKDAEIAAITKERDEALARIKASQEQEPVDAFRRKGNYEFCTCSKYRSVELENMPYLYETIQFYPAPVISPTEAELRAEIERLNVALAQANNLKNLYRGELEQTADMRNELTTLLAEERKKAVPEGWQLVPIEPTVEMSKSGSQYFSNLTHASSGYEFRADIVYQAMLSAAPKEKTE